MNFIPDILCNNIISYLPYEQQKNINKKYNIIIKKSYKYCINKIQLFYKKSKYRIINIWEQTNDFENLYNINKKELQALYILCYPDVYKNEYMYLTLTNSMPIHYKILHQIYNNPNLTTQRKFKLFISYLTISELTYIGW